MTLSGSRPGIIRTGRLYERAIGDDTAYNPREDDRVYHGTRILDLIEDQVTGGVDWWKEQSKDKEGISDDIFRLVGGGAMNIATAISYIPGIKQLGQFEDWVAAQARDLSANVAPDLDPRIAGWLSRVGTGVLTDKGIGLAGKGARAGVKLAGNTVISAIEDLTGLYDIGTGIGKSGIDFTYGFGIPKRFTRQKGFTGKNLEFLQRYIRLATKHRYLRSIEGTAIPKRHLMKRFDVGKTNPLGTILDDAGEEMVLVYNKKKGFDNPVDPENWSLRSLKKIEADALKQAERGAGYTKTAKGMQSIRTQLWKSFRNIIDTPENLQMYHNRLRESGGYVYLEHKLAKGMDWFWNAKKADPNFARWAPSGRNTAFNLRLLFDPGFKALKDVTEGHLKRINKTLDPAKRLLIDLDDPIPQGRVPKIVERNSPGNILIRRAGDGRIVGEIGQYLGPLYKYSFQQAYDSTAKLLTKTIDPLTNKPIIRRIKTKKGGYRIETMTEWRRRFIRERVEWIVKQIPKLEGLTDSAVRMIIETSPYGLNEDMMRIMEWFPDIEPPSMIGLDEIQSWK